MKHWVAILALATAAAIFGAYTAQADQPIYLYGSLSGAYTPGHSIPIQFETNATRSVPVQVFVYRLPLARAIAFTQNLDRGSDQNVADLERVATFQAVAPEDNATTRIGAIPALPIGYYVLDASIRGSSSRVQTLFA